MHHGAEGKGCDRESRADTAEGAAAGAAAAAEGGAEGGAGVSDAQSAEERGKSACQQRLRERREKKQALAEEQRAYLRWFGVPLLWRAFQDGSLAAPDVALAAIRLFVELVLRNCAPAADSARLQLEYVDAAIANLAAGVSVVPSLAVAEALVSALPERQMVSALTGANGPRLTQSVLLLQLDRSHGLAELVVRDCERFKQRAATPVTGAVTPVTPVTSGPIAAADAAAASAAESGGASPIPISHMVALEARLGFLRFVAGAVAAAGGPEAVNLTPDHVRRLWQCFVPGALCAAETSTFLAWLGGSSSSTACASAVATLLPAVSHKYSSLGATYYSRSLAGETPSLWLPADLAGVVFDELLCGPQSRTEDATLDGFRCFQAFFFACNARLIQQSAPPPPKASSYFGAQPSSAAGSASGSVFSARSLDLRGMEALWDLALRATDAAVACSASALLVSLVVRCDAPPAPQSKRAVWEARFVAPLMARLAGAVETLSAASSSVLVSVTPAAAPETVDAAAAAHLAGAALRVLNAFLDSLSRACLPQPVLGWAPVSPPAGHVSARFCLKIGGSITSEVREQGMGCDI